MAPQRLETSAYLPMSHGFWPELGTQTLRADNLVPLPSHPDHPCLHPIATTQ